MFDYKLKVFEHDYISFNIYHTIYDKIGKKGYTLLRLLIPLMFVYMLAYEVFTAQEFRFILGAATVYTVFGTLWFFLCKYIYILFIKLHIKMLKKRGKLPYLAESEVIINDDCIEEISPNTTCNIKFAEIERIVEYNGCVYIYLSVASAIIIPATAFVSDAERQKLIAFINSKISCNK